MATQRPRLTEPLESTTWLFGVWMAMALLASAVASWLGSGSVGGFGDASVCETLTSTFDDTGTSPTSVGVSARPGATIDTWGYFHACAVSPTAGQRIWFTLTSVPAFLFWACLLWMLWRMLSTARTRGPFAPPMAVALRRLAWFIIAGSAVAASVHGLALDMVINSLVRPGIGLGDAVSGPIRGLLPVPLIAGAAVLTFARIIGVGQAMDEEIRATV